MLSLFLFGCRKQFNCSSKRGVVVVVVVVVGCEIFDFFGEETKRDKQWQEP